MDGDYKAIDSVTTAQQDKDLRTGSVEEIILSRQSLKNRTRLEYSVVKHASEPQMRLLEVWLNEDVNFHEPTKSLFIDGYLASTTSPSGIAHSEALVHPTMVAHPSPSRALVMSLTPNTIVKEVLKYKSIEHVSVVGSDLKATELISKHMPVMSDCHFLPNEDSVNCMASKKVHLVRGDVRAWLNRMGGLLEKFDVIYVDVPVGDNDWLSVDFYKALLRVSAEETIIVVSSGSSPTLFEVNTETELSPRENLIRQAERRELRGGLSRDILVYDEVKPLWHMLVYCFCL